MKTLDDHAAPRVISSRPSLREQVVQIWAYRSLIARMVRKELQVKYKSSFLGFFWSMLNPALYLVVFWFVFEVILQSGIPNFAIFLLSGLLAWNLYSSAVSGATSSITGNAALVGKVYFPREVLPLASVGAALVHFVLQGVVLVLALVLFNYEISFTHSAAVPVALLVLLVLSTGLALLLSAANVYFRDMQHLVELGLLAWFWITPIVYHQQLIAERLDGRSFEWVQWLNPLAPIVLTFQRGIYNVVAAGDVVPSPKFGGAAEGAGAGSLQILPSGMDFGWYAVHLGGVAAAAVVILVLGLFVFGRLSGNFAEEI